MTNWNDFDTIKMLIAEDDLFNREMLISIFLGYLNIEIHEARDGEEALFKILRNHYDVVLLDVHMPKKTGIEILKMMRRTERFINTPVIIITSSEDDKTKSLQLGANDFLVKPYDALELQIRVYNQLKLSKYSKSLQESIKQEHGKLLEKIDKIEDTQRKLLIKFAMYSERQIGNTNTRKVEKIAMYSKILSGYCCEMPEERQKDIYYAAAIHNIGFFVLPEYIRLKKDKFTTQEAEIMKKHIIYGSNFLKGLEETDLIEVARPIVEQYCERWDGKGYPLGLKGDEISIYARIVSICVFFNALSSPRDYRDKKVFSDGEIYDLLKEQSGKVFDPIIVEVFLVHFNKFLHIRDKFK